jgi:DNA-binding PadR family transcriptional regulator
MSSTRLLVLGVVRIFQPVHGYDVRRELLSWRADQWANVAPGSIYSALKSLVKDGLLEIEGTDQVGGRPERTSYRLTDEGEKEFHNLLRATWWSIGQPLDPLMPGVCFLPAMQKDELIAALKHRQTQIDGILKHMDFIIAGIPGSTTTPAHVAELLRLSAARAGAETAWAKALIATLERGDYDAHGPAMAARIAGRSKAAQATVDKAAPAKAARAARVNRSRAKGRTKIVT